MSPRTAPTEVQQHPRPRDSGASVTLEEGQTLRAYAFTDAKYPSPVVEKAYSA